MLELRDVSFRVDDEKDKEKDILEHVSFTLEDNKFVEAYRRKDLL